MCVCVCVWARVCVFVYVYVCACACVCEFSKPLHNFKVKYYRFEHGVFLLPFWLPCQSLDLAIARRRGELMPIPGT